jgi:hypothetical protein
VEEVRGPRVVEKTLKIPRPASTSKARVSEINIWFPDLRDVTSASCWLL